MDGLRLRASSVPLLVSPCTLSDSELPLPDDLEEDDEDPADAAAADDSRGPVRWRLVGVGVVAVAALAMIQAARSQKG